MRRRWAVFASRHASTIVNGRDRAADVIQLSERSLNCAAHQVSRYSNCEHDHKQSHKQAVGKPRRRISSWTCRPRTQHPLTARKSSDHLALSSAELDLAAAASVRNVSSKTRFSLQAYDGAKLRDKRNQDQFMPQSAIGLIAIAALAVS